MPQGDPPVLQQAGPDERGAQPMEGEGGEQHPDGERPKPGRGSEPLAREDQRPEQGVEQDEQLVPEQLVLRPARAGGPGPAKQEGDLGGGEGEHATLDAEDPAPRDRADDPDGADQLEPAGAGHGRRRRLRPLLHRDDPEVAQPEHQGGEVARAAELAELAASRLCAERQAR